jgi:hypothetical protein
MPKSWFMIPLTSDDLARRIESVSEANPQFKEIAQAFMLMDPDIIRVVALNMDTKYIINGFSTNITVTAIEDQLMAAMPLDFVTGALEESMKQGGATLIPGQELASTNTNGVEIGSFEFQQTALTSLGTTVPVHSKILVFQANGKLILIQVATPTQVEKEILPVLDEIMDTVKLVES